MNKLEQALLMFDRIDRLVKQNCNIVIDKGIKSAEEIAEEILSQFKK
jgi:hypothetical protein